MKKYVIEAIKTVVEYFTVYAKDEDEAIEKWEKEYKNSGWVAEDLNEEEEREDAIN